MMPTKTKMKPAVKKQVRAASASFCIAQYRKEAREAAQSASDDGLDVIIRKQQSRMRLFLGGDSRYVCTIHIDEARAEKNRRHLPR